MKKAIAYILFILAILSVLSGCKQNVPSDTSAVSSDTFTENSDSYTSETSVPVDTESDVVPQPTFKMHVIDGSTSTIPLEAGIRSHFFNIPLEEAESQVSHTTTYLSFVYLITNKCDLILTVPLSQEQYDRAASKGVAIEKTAIAMEGFVFVVNADNPVETLTQQQLKDIYSGKITNWKEVGGSDAEIIAYQRNEESGSQNYMKAFMTDAELMEPVTETRPGTMGGLMDAISSYDNSVNAIGYSVYSYAAEMYVAASKVKFIKVDGIAANHQTMADGTYPLLSYNYAVIRADSPADSPERELVKWIVSHEGQNAVAESGYIPVSNIKASLEADIVMPLLSKGTGAEKPDGYEAPNTYYTIHSSNYLRYDVVNKKTTNHRIEGLKNKELQSEINKFITDSKKLAQAYTAEAEEYSKRVYASYGFKCDVETIIESECINGYLSVAISLTYTEPVQDSPTYYYKSYTAVWDLFSGKKLSFPDMFWKDSEFIKQVNNGISVELNSPQGRTYNLPTEFWALPEDFNKFSLSSIYFSSNDGNFINGVKLDYLSHCKDTLVTSELRDMSGLFENGSYVHRIYYIYNSTDTGTRADFTKGVASMEIDPVKSKVNADVCKKINDYMRNAVIENLSTEALDAHFGKDNYEIAFGIESSFVIYDRAYIIFTGGAYIDFKDNRKSESYGIRTAFDYYTGNIITLDDILNDGWRDAAGSKKSLDNVYISGYVEYEYSNFRIRVINSSGDLFDIYLPYKYLKIIP